MGAKFTKVTRRPGRKRSERYTVTSTQTWWDLGLPGDNRMASTDASVIFLSVQSPNQFPCEISYTPTGVIAPGYRSES
ncbi:hypothetical protein ACIQVO_38685 [Streptomyces sp. NPDC101062]|uniref:hypothetical protein n=1 Tax=unclassified Streptomyces TaxID=2593676 RepID=UPI0037F403F7